MSKWLNEELIKDSYKMIADVYHTYSLSLHACFKEIEKSRPNELGGKIDFNEFSFRNLDYEKMTEAENYFNSFFERQSLDLQFTDNCKLNYAISYFMNFLFRAELDAININKPMSFLFSAEEHRIVSILCSNIEDINRLVVNQMVATDLLDFDIDDIDGSDGFNHFYQLSDFKEKVDCKRSALIQHWFGPRGNLKSYIGVAGGEGGQKAMEKRILRAKKIIMANSKIGSNGVLNITKEHWHKAMTEKGKVVSYSRPTRDGYKAKIENQISMEKDQRITINILK